MVVDDWARLGYECVLDGAAAGRVYAEVFVTPARHLADTLILRMAAGTPAPEMTSMVS